MKTNGKAPASAESLRINREAEVAVLGGSILDKSGTAFRQARELMRPEFFGMKSHRTIWKCMVELVDAGKPLDYVTIPDTLDAHGELVGVGGNAYIMSLTDGLPRSQNIAHHVGILRREAAFRGLLKLSETAAELSQKTDIDAEEALAEFEKKFDTLKAWSKPPIPHSGENGAALLTELAVYTGRYVLLTKPQLVVNTLWVMHTYTISNPGITPYLHVSSAEKMSGKTRLLEVNATVVKNPWMPSRASVAALPRKIESTRPTLLLDEIDCALKSGDEYSAALTGILNSGYTSTGVTSVCVPPSNKVVDFSTYCPKILCGIGQLPDTIASRSIPIRLKRKTADEPIQRFRLKQVQTYSTALRTRLESWAAANYAALEKAEPDLPNELSDRQQDIAESILAIADRAGGDWPTNARQALTELFTGKEKDADTSSKVELLRDIKAVFDERDIDRLSSSTLVESLVEMADRPWAECNRGKPMTQHYLAKMLSKFDDGSERRIEPGQLRDGSEKIRGYLKSAFSDAWTRYLKPVPLSDSFVPVAKMQEIANKDAGCTDVPVTSGGMDVAEPEPGDFRLRESAR